MKYTFFINQEAIANAGLLDKTDVFDWMILSYIKEWGDTKQGLRKGTKTWINYKHLMADMPMLGIKHKSGVSRKIKNLVELGLLETELDFVEQKLYAETTPYYSQIVYSKNSDLTIPKRERPVAVEERPVAVEERPVAVEERPVAVEERPVAVEERPVAVVQPIHIPVSIHQDSNTKCNAEALARFKKPEPEKQKAEGKTSLVELVRPWYLAQGYSEDIEAHFGYFMNRLATYSRIPIDLQGHFVRAITEDWAGLRKPKEDRPEWAMVPDGTEPGDEGNNLCKFIEKHGFPNKLRWLKIAECRAELRKLAAQRLVETRLS